MQVTAFARRWNDFYGNTYHTVKVWVDDEFVGLSPITYGYGTHYLHTAGELLIREGYDLRDAYDLSIMDGLIHDAADVGRKRDLH